MDRFIANYNTEKGATLTDLKSNMDRFIVLQDMKKNI